MVKVGSMRRRILLIASMLLLTAGVSSASWRHKADRQPEPAAPAAMTLTAVEFEPAPASRLVLRTSGAPAYTSYSPAPDTFVVDLSNVSKAPSLAVPSPLPPSVTSVTAEEVTEMGTRVTRVTVKLSQPSTLQASAGDHSVTVALPAKEEPLPPVVAAIPAPEPAPAPETAKTETAKPIADEPAVKSEALPQAKAKTLKNVTTSGSGGSLSVQLSADGDVAYNAFSLEKPSRLVIDLNGVADKVAKSAISVNGSVVKKIRVAQFKGGPDPVTRVVLDLAAKSPYKVTKADDGLVVTFDGVQTAEEVRKPEPKPEPAPPMTAISEPVKSADAAQAPIDVPKPVDAPPKPQQQQQKSVETVPQKSADAAPQKPAEIPAQVPVIAEPVPVPQTTVAETAPEPKPKAKAPEWKMPEKQAVKGVIRGGQQPAAPKPSTRKITVQPQPAAAEDVFTDAPQALPTLGSNTQTGPLPTLGSTAAAGGRTLGPGERVYTGEPISLSLKDADLKDVIRTFANLTGLNIAVDPGVNGSVTVDFNDVPWDQALDIILRQNNLGYVLEGNVMRVGTLNRLAEEAAASRKLADEGRLNVPLRTVSYKLSYARAPEVSGLLREIASPRARIIVDARTNQLIISEIPSYLETMRALIDSVDVPTRQVMIEARIVETSKTFIQQYGFQWGFQGTMDPSLGTGTGLVFPNRVDLVGGPFSFAPGVPVLTFHMGNVLGTFNLDFQLNATETEGLSRVVSAPRVQTQDNVAAEIQSGFQIPFQTRINFTTTVAYVDATLRLSVTPQITESGTVIMDINVQKNEPALGLAVEGGAGTPLSTRTAHTRLMVRDGGTAVIAGIYQTKENNGQTRLPFLHQIPIIGNLFKTHDISNSHDELLIFITPRIVRSL
jgi:type IV pilus assembly protein PilQ